MVVSWTMASNLSSKMVALTPKKIILTRLAMAHVIQTGYVNFDAKISSFSEKSIFVAY